MAALLSSTGARDLLAARVPRRRSADAVRYAGAAALIVAAAVHAQQWLSIFHAVPRIGVLFAADAVASLAIAVVVIGTRRRVVAAAGALVSAGALAGLAVSSTVGLLGWTEATLRPSVVIAIVAESVAVATLGALAIAPGGVRVPVDRARALAATGLLAIAAVHVAAAPAEWGDTRDVFWLFVALATTYAGVAIRLALGPAAWTSKAVLVLAAAPAAGYILSRATALPGDGADVGEWVTPLGLVALALEAALVIHSLRDVVGRAIAGSRTPEEMRA